MMATTNNGGPAFPQAQIAGENVPVDLAEMGGMSLRDYFAAKAMQALIAREFGKGENAQHASVAITALSYADAMLAQRSKEKP